MTRTRMALKGSFRMQFRSVGLLAVVVIMAATTGCGRGKFATVPVSGQVKLDGEPVARITLLFSPVRQGDSREAGPSSMATTDGEGRYQLVVARQGGGKGAVPGKHLVGFSGLEDYDQLLKESGENKSTQAPTMVEAPRHVMPSDLPSVRIPMKYALRPLEFVVPPQGTSVADFDLTSR